METKAPPLPILPVDSGAPAVLGAYLQFMHLKQLYRQGWLRNGVPRERCESVAEHSFGVAALALFVAGAQPGIDPHKALRMALLHDFGEVYAGDFTPADAMPPQEKHRLEALSVAEVLAGVPGVELYLADWEEFERGESAEAQLVRQLDRLELGLQAAVYEQQGLLDPADFYVTVEAALNTPELRLVFEGRRVLSHLADLFDAVDAGDRARLQTILAERPELARARSPKGLLAPLAALYRGKEEMAQLLAQQAGDLDLPEAAALGNLSRVKTLVEQDTGAVNRFATDGFSPLGLASYFGRREIVDFLLAAGADPNLHSNNALQVPPLGSAASAERLEIARTLLDAGADPNSLSADGFTPLHSAAQNGQIDMIDLLLERGANPNIRSDDSRLPLDMARGAGHTSAVERLRNAGTVEDGGE